MNVTHYDKGQKFPLPSISINRICMILKKQWKVDFTDNNIRYILGFDNKEYEHINEESHKDFIGEYVAKIEKDVRQLQIHCNYVYGSYGMHKSGLLFKNDVIYSFTPNVSPKSWMTKTFNNNYYFRLQTTQLQEYEVSITDQGNNDIDFNEEKCALSFEIVQEID